MLGADVKVAYADPLVTLHQGDSLDVLACLEPESVQVCVTSPPYWGLRSYEGDTGRVWGGNDPACEHEWSVMNKAVSHEPSEHSTLDGGRGPRQVSASTEQADCLRCGAWRGSYGLEPFHDCLGWARGERCARCYVCHSLAFLDAINLVLRKDGIVLWNLGDSYAGSTGSGGKTAKQVTNAGSFHNGGMHIAPGLKSKDMVLIPQRVALAAQATGWWVRSDIIWVKPNPMPESTTDRPTRSYEHILMLTKSARYYWDAEAVREPVLWASDPRAGRGHIDYNGKRNGVIGQGQRAFVSIDPKGRNIRDVWNISTEPFPGSHFATFPEAIPDRAIRAATSEHGACSVCGAPWERVVEKGAPVLNAWSANGAAQYDDSIGRMRPAGLETGSTLKHVVPVSTVGWQPACSHADAPVVPCVVLDPFAGSGTTLAVAKRLGRRTVGIEIGESYVKLAINRIQGETARLL